MINPFSPRVTIKRMRPFFGKVKGTADGGASCDEAAGGVGADSLGSGSTGADSSKVGVGETAATAGVDAFDCVVPASDGTACAREGVRARCGLGARAIAEGGATCGRSVALGLLGEVGGVGGVGRSTASSLGAGSSAPDVGSSHAGLSSAVICKTAEARSANAKGISGIARQVM